MISLEQLRVFVALNKAGSFTKTAEILNKAQSAVTYAIKSLESELGITLLDRTGYRAKVTAAGEVLLPRAEEMLKMADEIGDLSRIMKEGWEPRINIVTHGILPIANIMPLLKESLRLKYPTQISLRVEILSGISESIKALQPELVVTPLESIEIPKNYNAVRIGSISLIPVVSPGHPLAKDQFPIPLHILRKHVHLIVSDSAVSPQPLDFLLIGAEEHWNFPDFYSRREGLRAGVGFAWMPTYLVEKDINEGRLIPLVLEVQNIHSYDIGVLYRLSPMLGPAGLFLLELLKTSSQILPEIPEHLISIYPGEGK